MRCLQRYDAHPYRAVRPTEHKSGGGALKKFEFQDQDGTKLTVKRSRERAAITVNDGWHDVVIVVAGTDLDQLRHTLNGD